jgi:hypothetical protein
LNQKDCKDLKEVRSSLPDCHCRGDDLSAW